MWYGFRLQKADQTTPKEGDVVTVDSDSGGVDAAPCTFVVLSADGWKVEFSRGEFLTLDPNNVDDTDGMGNGGTHWFFSKGDKPAPAAKPQAKPYVHPYRDEQGNFTTKDKDATFKGTGTTRDQHDANIATGEKHGFKATTDDLTATTMEKKRYRLFIDHAQGQFAHTIQYQSGGSRQFKGHVQHMDEHLKQWS